MAKATDKTTKPVQEEKPVKATKTAKAQKETPVKETAVKESPVKEDNAPKATKTVEKDEETVLVEGEGKVHGKYVIKKTDKGNFVFKLFSSNYRVVAIGAQAYTTLGAAKIGVQSIINNAEKAPVENQTLKNYETLKFPKWEIYLDKKANIVFVCTQPTAASSQPPTTVMRTSAAQRTALPQLQEQARVAQS